VKRETSKEGADQKHLTNTASRFTLSNVLFGQDDRADHRHE
jgi:hypothetical protein